MRVIADTNRNLDKVVGESGVREDLLYRLNTVRFNSKKMRLEDRISSKIVIC